MAHLELAHLVKQYGTSYAVRDVSLTVGDGEIVCLLGPSGCGKTTTLRIIGGFITPDSGDVRIDGTSVTRQPPERRPTGMVFQRYTLWPHMDIWHNVAFGLELRRLSRPKIDRAVRDALELVGLPGVERRRPSQLSGGQQQRVALARALVLEPRILLLDEPLSNLDAQLRVRMREEITAIQRRVGITTVFVTHDQEEALSIADRIAVMRAGVLEQIDTPSDLYAYPATLFVATFIGTMNLIDGQVNENRRVVAGPFRLDLPDGVDVPRGTTVTVGIRPEDLSIGGHGDGEVFADVLQTTDLGHYQRVQLDVPQIGKMIAFATKAEVVARGNTVVRPRRTLFYVNDRLIGIDQSGTAIMAARSAAAMNGH